MPHFMIGVLRPNGFDHASQLDAAARTEIAALNDQMVAEGLRVFVGGLQAPVTAVMIDPADDHQHYGKSADHYLDGFWVLEVPDMSVACDWGRKAAHACRARIEVRPFN